jgi:FemAB-related protein (PEP-CTERM system-associated)
VDVVLADNLERWTQYVRSRPAANHGLRPEWRAIIQGAYGLRSHYLEAYDDGRCVGVLPLYEQPTLFWGKALISIPFSTYGGVLADSQEATKALIAQAEQLGRSTGAKYVELRQVHPSGQPLQTHTNNVRTCCRLDESDETHLQRLNQRTRRELRKCHAERLTVRFGPDCLQAFYSLWADRGPAFFSEAQSAFGEDLWTALVEWQGRPVAAGMCLVWHDTCNFLWAAAARQAGNCSPNYLLYWACIQRARQQALLHFDMSRATKGSTVLAFKRTWRGDETDLPYQYVELNGEIPPEAGVLTRSRRLLIRMWQALPAPVAGALGPWACRRIPVY